METEKRDIIVRVCLFVIKKILISDFGVDIRFFERVVSGRREFLAIFSCGHATL